MVRKLNRLLEPRRPDAGRAARSFAASLFVLGLVLLWCESLPAQARSTTGGSSRGTQSVSGMFGSRTLGGTANATQNMQGGNVAVGNGGGVESAQQGAGAVSGDERFLRENRQPGAFVGADRADAVNLRSQATAQNAQQGLRNLQGLFQQLGRGNEFNGQGNGQQNGNRTQIRVPLRLGFQPRPVAAQQFTARFEQRLTKLPGLQTPEPIQVVMEGRTAILRGTVASESDRALAEGLARLEPEVLDVKNELVVDPAASTAEELPPAPAGPLPSLP